uniref:Uncharacterized protein n=1 Tax=uncultured Verrucomicrobiota bacterium TaxID=156588 RepID=D2DXU5_9BACT|nr:conserved hypothetical protein [uncultured Verrucomicrobiota bacterium]
MQAPHFLSRGLDLSAFHLGTLNVSVAPMRYEVVAPVLTFRAVKWHPVEPAEDFSFFEVRLVAHAVHPVAGLIYYPHPETKPEHFQEADVLELLLPWTEGLAYGSQISIQVPPDQMVFRQ